MKNQIPHIKQSKIGKFIARGLDFDVYHYDKKYVIKYSRLSLIFGAKHQNKLIYDYAICSEYLKKYIVPSISVGNNSQYIELQPYIKGSILCSKDLSHHHIRKQFQDMVKCIHHLQHDGYPAIDLIGLPGLYTNRFDNVIIDHKQQLKIIDATLLESRSIGWIGYLIQPLLWIASMIQDRKIKILLKNLT